MRAAQITAYGGKDTLQIATDAPKPKAEAGQLVIEIRAAGVNPFDWKVREGYMQKVADLQFPAILGGDFAGIVAEIGEGVHGFALGDEVYGQAGALSGQGSYAEFTLVKADSVAVKPTSIDMIAAATLPLAGVSAYQALVEHAELKAGQKILIHGGAGGIGSFAIQLAKYVGAQVATTAKASAAAFVKSLGADQVIDYEAQQFAALLHDFDVVYDTIGDDTFTKSFKVLRPGGIIVSMVAQPDEALQEQYHVRVVGQFTRVTNQRLTELAKLVDSGTLKPHIDKVFPLEQAAEALAYLQEGKQRGKVVLNVTATSAP
jgi:alcohol dehydrogenase